MCQILTFNIYFQKFPSFHSKHVFSSNFLVNRFSSNRFWTFFLSIFQKPNWLLEKNYRKVTCDQNGLISIFRWKKLWAYYFLYIFGKNGLGIFCLHLVYKWRTLRTKKMPVFTGVIFVTLNVANIVTIKNIYWHQNTKNAYVVNKWIRMETKKCR